MAAQPKFSNEWLAGATLGGYVVFSVVLFGFGRELIHYYCGNVLPPSTIDVLFFLIPGTVVGLLSFGQIRLARLPENESLEKAIRVALWLNAFAVACLCTAFALQGLGELNWIRVAVVLTGMACFVAGILGSIANLLRGIIRRARA